MKARLLIVCIIFISLVILVNAKDAAQKEMESEQVYQLLAASPLWPDVDGEGSASAKEQINENFSKIALYETPIIRVAVNKYINHCFGGESYDPKLRFSVYNIVVLNRFIFNVPEFIGRDELGKLPFYFGVRLPQDEASVNLLWPVTIGKDGNLKLTGSFYTYAYSGPRAQPLKEFDIFNKAFGRRSKQTAVTSACNSGTNSSGNAPQIP